MINWTTKEVDKTLNETMANRTFLQEKYKGLSFFKDENRVLELKEHLFWTEVSRLYRNYVPEKGQDEALVYELIEQEAHSQVHGLLFSLNQFYHLIDYVLNQKKEHLKKISPNHYEARLSYLYRWLVEMLTHINDDIDFLISENQREKLFNHENFFKINKSFVGVLDETP